MCLSEKLKSTCLDCKIQFMTVGNFLSAIITLLTCLYEVAMVKQALLSSL